MVARPSRFSSSDAAAASVRARPSISSSGPSDAAGQDHRGKPRHVRPPQRRLDGRQAEDAARQMDRGEANARAEVEQARHQPRIDRAEQQLGERRACAEQHGGGEGEQDARLHERDLRTRPGRVRSRPTLPVRSRPCSRLHALTPAVASRGPARPACRSRRARAWVRSPQRHCRRSTSSRCCSSRCRACSLCSMRHVRRRRRRGAAGGSASATTCSGLYWITEAILFEAARFWWLVPLAVPALAAVLARLHRRRLRRGAAGAAGLAARPGAGRRLGAGGPGAAVRADRISRGTRGAACGRFPGRSATCSSSPPPGSACTGSPWPRCCSRRPRARLALARRRRGAARRLGRFGVVRLRQAIAAAGADRRAGAGQRRAGPEVGPGPRGADLPSTTWPEPTQARRPATARPWRSGRRPRFPACCDVDEPARLAIARATGGRPHWSAASASTSGSVRATACSR